MYGLKKTVTGKYTAAEVEQVIESIKKEYEETGASQKDRILALRNENASLKSELSDLEEKKSMLLTALISAQKSSKEIIEAAKHQAVSIVEAAEAREREIEKTIESHTKSLDELKVHCETILKSIDLEIAKYNNPEKTFLIEPQPLPVRRKSAKQANQA